ncbi:hypothetical protein J6590_062886 [Homalodisca vitripennis]|nr:hypothetical protein J6590_062886 [Homalodisca vitripennis]
MNMTSETASDTRRCSKRKAGRALEEQTVESKCRESVCSYDFVGHLLLNAFAANEWVAAHGGQAVQSVDYVPCQMNGNDTVEGVTL